MRKAYKALQAVLISAGSRHVAPKTPGSIHEGITGYVAACLVRFDNPDLIVTVSPQASRDGTTGQMAGNKFLNRIAMGPLAHPPTAIRSNLCFLARIPREELEALFVGYGYKPYFVEGRESQSVHQQLAEVLDAVVAEIKQIWAEARAKGAEIKRPAWPMIVFRSPKGWTCPAEIDGKKCEDYWRSHQVPMGDMDKPDHIKILRNG